MRGLRVGVIAGTSEATELIAALPRHYAVTAFAATAYGKTILQGLPCQVQVGRLDAAGFSRALEHMDVVVDASHPFAVEVTKTVRQVCQTLGLPCFRMGRQKQTYAYEHLIPVQDAAEAAAVLSRMAGNILLTTGGNTLSFYESAVPDFARRGWARILDTPESRACTANSQAHLIYAMPPFSREETEALLREHKIAVLVTKDSGARGGVADKIEAAKAVGIPVVMLRAPQEETMDIPQIVAALAAVEQSRP